jgi:hypothetical protein
MAFGKQTRQERFRRLAQRIEELRRKDETTLAFRRQIEQQRCEAVQRLWNMCRSFADSLNSMMAAPDRLELTPAEPPAGIPEDESLQIMLNVRGRILLLDLRVPAYLVSSDNFKRPYTLEGEVRFFNQVLLEDERVEEHGLFFCPSEGDNGAWVFWNGRSYKEGLADEEYLAGLLEQIL